MKKKILLVISSLSTLLFASCNAEPCEECAKCEPCSCPHTFSSEWSSNDSCHWHDATCKHTEYTKDLAEHTYGEDGFCTVCNHETPEHFKKLIFSGEHCKVANAQEKYHLGDEVTILIETDENYAILTCVVSGLDNHQINKKTGVITGVVADDITISVITKDTRSREYIKKIGGVYNKYNEKMYKTFDYDEENRKVTIVKVKESTEVPFYESYTYTYSEDHLTRTYDYSSYEGVSVTERTITKYDEDGKMLEESYYRAVASELDFVRKEVYSYDEFNRLISKDTFNNENGEGNASKREVYEYFDGHYEFKQLSLDDSDQEYKLRRYFDYVETIDVENNRKIVETYDLTGGVEDPELDGYKVYDLTTGKLLQNGSFDIPFSSYMEKYEYNENGDNTLYAAYGIEDGVTYELNALHSSYDEAGFLDSSYLSFQMTETIHYENFAEVDFIRDNTNKVIQAKFSSQANPSAGMTTIGYEYETIIVEDWAPAELLEAYMPGSYPMLIESFEMNFLETYFY